ncbi:MAG TPA: sulfotransferase [Actinomycetota bacterium]|nr:sulfotransferase [Actinomycetota bacterium]
MSAPAGEGPPFFVVGSARSGTTLLRLMLNAHPAISVPPESRFVVELWRGSEDVDAETTLGALSRHRLFAAWDLPIEAVRAELGRSGTVRYADVMTAAYRAFAHLRGKPRWGDKTPRYVEHLPLLARLWPDARFVHLVRDGRDVALSYADVPFGPTRVAESAALWASRVSTGVVHGRALGPGRYLEMRYEELVADPAAGARALCDFLAVDFDARMLDYAQRARDAVLPRAARYNPHVTEPPRTDTRSWQADMPPEHVEVFEAIAGDVLSMLGYPRRYPQPGRRARTRARLARLGVPLDVLRSTRAGPGDPSGARG